MAPFGPFQAETKTHKMKTTILTSLLTILVAGSLSAQMPSPTPRDQKAVITRPPAPPKERRTATTKIVPKNNDEKALNPQPLPPVDDNVKSKITRKNTEETSLNPQPLPPKDGDKKSRIIRKNTEETPLNPQPLPPKDDRPHPNTNLVLSNGATARIVGKNMMISSAKGETKAAAGTYKTRDGRVLVVNARGEISN
jgi:hypothetical protein